MTGAHSARPAPPGEHWSRAWAAFVFGAIAVIALGLIAFVLTTQPVESPEAGPPMLLTEVPTHSAEASSSARASTPGRRTSTAPRTTTASSTAAASVPTTSTVRSTPTVVATRSSSTAPPPRRPAAPCGSGRPCVVSGAGQVSTALTAYRRGHGQIEVPVAVTSAAQQCAVTGGDGPSCGDPFAVAREWQPSGRAAVQHIGAGTGNFLLDPGLRAVEIGWAYDPGTGQYVCALIARS